jgi:hypothetical protein
MDELAGREDQSAESEVLCLTNRSNGLSGFAAPETNNRWQARFPQRDLLPENWIILSAALNLSTEKVSEYIQINVYMIVNDCYLL